jgi:hypothetical protein
MTSPPAKTARSNSPPPLVGLLYGFGNGSWLMSLALAGRGYFAMRYTTYRNAPPASSTRTTSGTRDKIDRFDWSIPHLFPGGGPPAHPEKADRFRLTRSNVIAART